MHYGTGPRPRKRLRRRDKAAAKSFQSFLVRY
jgi:hypothetical protein